MRPTTKLISAAACLLTVTLATGVCAQQTTAAPATSSLAPVNNTEVNKRDRSDHTLTSVDQPNDKADIKLAAAVRRTIVKDKTLSMTAHNIKLIAAKGVVTLRGPVANADEKAKVEADARSVSGVTSVDNQLDVKTP